ncbi:hypothetical protein [Flavobacterium sp. N1736]|uniref:hypothetical protein n=1 Tax=Flavobacterium sp. N1736 TaxID=2986823 RepID=UPI0022245302|nr:hypothetical protein [Flavobacterium sp. N1736]
MEGKLPKMIITAAVGMVFSLSTVAQVTDKSVNQKTVSENGQPGLITFSDQSTYKTSDSQKVFQDQLGLKENQSFIKIKTESDPEGFTHEKFQLYQQGIKVEFASYNLHSKNGKLTAMNGEYYNIQNVKTSPVLSPEEALNKAIIHINAKQYMWETPEDAKRMNYQKPKGELVLLPIWKIREKAEPKIKFGSLINLIFMQQTQ